MSRTGSRISVTVLGDDGDLADAPLDGSVVLGLVHGRAVGVPGGVVHHSLVGKIVRDGECAALGVVDEDGAHGARVVGVSGHARNLVTVHGLVELDHTAPGGATCLHHEPVHRHASDIGSYLWAKLSHCGFLLTNLITFLQQKVTRWCFPKSNNNRPTARRGRS